MYAHIPPQTHTLEEAVPRPEVVTVFGLRREAVAEVMAPHGMPGPFAKHLLVPGCRAECPPGVSKFNPSAEEDGAAIRISLRRARGSEKRRQLPEAKATINRV